MEEVAIRTGRANLGPACPLKSLVCPPREIRISHFVGQQQSTPIFAVDCFQFSQKLASAPMSEQLCCDSAEFIPIVPLTYCIFDL